MKRIVLLSIAALAFADSAQVNLDEIIVEGKVNSTIVKNVSQEEIKSADLAEALSQNSASISLVRRSGIANDIILRGQKKDNINIMIDDAKICGACPNRMDPPTSHIASNNVENVEIVEGPYDVENFGTLSGIVKIDTKKPTEKFTGDINLNAGSYGYKKASAGISGGTDKVKVAIGASTESGEQYEDGNGRTFAEQIESQTPLASTVRYQDKYKNMDAFEKKTFTGKVFFDITDNHEVQLGYMANRSDNILYPNSSMDALRDDSNIFTAKYIGKELSSFSQLLSLEYYYATVEHPMSTLYRVSATNIANEMTSYLETETQGLKAKNTLDIEGVKTTLGLDTNYRNWDGNYYKNGVLHVNPWNIPDVDTKNNAAFVELEKDIGGINYKFGVRYDDTSVEPNKGTYQSNDYQALNANIFATYKVDDTTKYFVGIGKSARVPDPRELYFISSANKLVGNPNLEQVKNYEADLGVEKTWGNLTLRTKFFYSVLKDYIYYNASLAQNNFVNLDAKIYGVDMGGTYLLSDAIFIDYSVAYQRGKKDNALPGQNDRDLAEIPPLKGILGFNYAYDATLKGKIELVAADKWKYYDLNNGEQALDSYSVVNLKVSKDVTKNINVTVGIENLFDKAYALSNTYKDLTLITATSGDVMLLNEPGRYFYINASYKF